jgi:hypothetical protein
MPTLFPDRLGGSARISEKVAFLVAHGSSDDSVPVELVRAVRIPHPSDRGRGQARDSFVTR